MKMTSMKIVVNQKVLGHRDWKHDKENQHQYLIEAVHTEPGLEKPLVDVEEKASAED